MKLRESIDNKVIEFDRAIAGAVSENVAKKLIRSKNRWLCKNDLFYLCCKTGHHKISEYADFYRPFCDEVSLINWAIVKYGVHQANEDLLPTQDVIDPNELVMQRLYLCYRMFYKTTIVTKVNTAQILLNFPNIHTCIAHNKQENASDVLVTIKNYFLTTVLKEWFPECVPDTKEWGNMTGFSLANRTDYNVDEQNLEAVGVDTEITGRHWQVAKKEDLVTDKSVNTEEQILKSSRWDDLFNIGHFHDSKRQIQDYSGTRYHYADMYSVKKNDPRVKLIEIPIMNQETGDITHKARYGVEDINDLKKDMWVFNCQMMLRPDDPAKMSFRQDMIAYFNVIPIECNFYLLVDPASKRKKKSDYTAMIVVGIDSEGRKYIVDVERDKLDPKQRIDLAIELAKKWKIMECGWEEVGLGDDNFYLEEKRRKEGVYFTVTPVKTHSVAKEDRIRNILTPEYASHKWLWPAKDTLVKYSLFHGRNFDMTQLIEDEFLHFPLWEHDDLLDCQTFLSQLSTVIPKKIENKEKRSRITYGELAKTIDDRHASRTKDLWKQLRPLERV